MPLSLRSIFANLDLSNMCQSIESNAITMQLSNYLNIIKDMGDEDIKWRDPIDPRYETPDGK